MALLKQARPDLSSAELKSILMGRGKSIGDDKKANYFLTRQGAGRVQTLQSALATITADRTAISLGEVNIEGQKVVRETIRFKNISKEAISANLSLDAVPGLSLTSGAGEVSLAAGESKEISLRFTLDAAKVIDASAELDGLLKLTQGEKEVHRVPVLAMVKKISQLLGKTLKVHAASAASAAGAAVDLTIQNKGSFAGLALPFNLLGVDQRKQDTRNDPFLSRACDLQAVGYRIVEKTVQDQKIKVLQIGAKVYEPMTTWNACEISVLIDSNGDQIAEQELAGIARGNVKGLSNATNEADFVSVLLDAPKARELRSKFEQEALAGKKSDEDYSKAVIDEQKISVFNHSTLVVVEADVTKLARRPNGQLAVKIATIFNEASSVEADDFLGNQARKWKMISLDEKTQSFVGLPESLSIKAGETVQAEFSKGESNENLLLLLPDNRTAISDSVNDDQLQIMPVRFR